MIGFVTWPPFCAIIYHVKLKSRLSIILHSFLIFYKGGQMTKPIIVVKIPCKLLYSIQVKGSSWPYLISRVTLLLVTYYF